MYFSRPLIVLYSNRQINFYPYQYSINDNYIIKYNDILKHYDIDNKTLTPPIVPVYLPYYVVLTTLFEMLK